MKKVHSNNLRNSRQRRRILELLQLSDAHPTADRIYSKLKKEFPKLSLGTVYRNLTILVEQDLVKKIHFGSTFDRFEAHMDQHYHLICEKCKNIFDFHMPVYNELNVKARQLTNFSIQRHMIEFFGTCQNCLEPKRRK